MLRFCSLLVAVLLAGQVFANEISGRVKVVDGDTITVAGQRVRLHGIDAPESDQVCITQTGAKWLCGGWVKRVVFDRYAGRRAVCSVKAIDRYGRNVARCLVRGEDMGGWLVREGMAFAYRKYSKVYVEHEKEAILFERGLHATTFQTPAKHRQNRVKKSVPKSDCNIKGNISASGRIYHMPGQRDYDRTGVHEASGERWFCSEAEARAAGWRRAKR